MKINFCVSKEPLPPTIDLPHAPKVGDFFEYFNNERNTKSVVTEISYIIGKGDPYVVVTLEEV